MRHFDHVPVLEWKKVPSAAVCAFAWCRWLGVDVSDVILQVMGDT
jgi:hypothetical protein